ncbi:unnamed protein product [Cylicocyclus nassatus]|uniref:Carboxylesterase type B domain-containing protein n=1 Tax=Cylicocyclus nassatus TaxID=53992 RepID=A0AA36DMJ3_CYLNA|nr:unnamed protein product [Cylicocyclus nassatus]
MFLIIILTYFSAITLAQIIELKEGKVRGFEYKTSKGEVAEIFLNIPYASPPVGDLRFEKPRSPSPWADILNGTIFGAKCTPFVTLKDDDTASEDCLTLNIIRPKRKAPASEVGFPILFWIHGGAYKSFSAVECGYKSLADTYTNRAVIIVTIQYRLGIYGFFSTGDELMPGNLGLLDMAEALKFVHSNALNFGGDPSRITVWGQGAGGAAAGQLALSPLTRDMVARSIEMSGSPWASWAIGSSVVDNSLRLAKFLECTKDIKACMKQKTTKEIKKAIIEMDDLNIVRWGPVIDGLFLQHPDEMAENAPRKVSIIGVTAKEAALFTVVGPPFWKNFKIDPADFPKWNRQTLIEKLTKYVKAIYVGKNLQKVTDKVLAYYVDRDEEENSDFYLDRYTEFLSDLFFNVPAVEGILSRVKAAHWEIYAYIFDHYGEVPWEEKIPKRLRRATHSSEFPFAIGVDELLDLGMTLKPEQQKFADYFGESFAEFAVEAHPLNHQKLWLEISEDPSIRYMNMSSIYELKKGFFKEASSFWQKLRKHGYDMVKMLPLRKIKKAAHTKEEL